MTDQFLKVLNLSFSATWVVLAVVLARLLLKRAPRGLVCALWGLVALRLLFGGIEAPFSLLPSNELIPPESLYDQAPAIHSGVSSIDNVVNPIYTGALRPSTGASVNPLQVWLAVFANLWILGMAAMSLWAAVSCLRVRKQVRVSLQADGFYLCDSISSPFIFGLLRPRIYLPSDLPESARPHVLAHERAHLRRRDHWWKPLGFALLTVNWFNPALWLSYVLLCRDIEMACDERVIREFSAEEKKSYSAALLRCSVNARRITACPLAFGEVGVKQRVKSVLNYRKPAFWIILAAAVLTLVLAAGLLTDPRSPDPEIRWEGTLYVQDGKSVKSLPDNAENVGTLRSALHDSTSHPNENGQSVHLDWEYAGQPLYLIDDVLYIEEPGGESWLPFTPKHSKADVLTLLDSTVQSQLNIPGESVCISEFVRDFGSRQDMLHLREILADESLQLQPSMKWEWSMIAVNYVSDDISIVIHPRDTDRHCLLLRREADWLLVYWDETLATSAWTFESPDLDAAIKPWQNELAYATELFSEFTTEENPIYLQYESLTMLDVTMRAAIPGYNFGSDTTLTHWEWQGNVSYDDKTMSFMCRPFGKAAWMRVNYYDSSDARYAGTFQTEPITLSSGAAGTLCHTGDPATWELIDLETDRGQLLVELDTTHGPADWTEEDYRMALTILGTLSLAEDGVTLFPSPAPSAKESDLGISMQLENITVEGATLICTQDGSLWHELTTGANWSLQEYRDGIWADLLPEETVWTTEAYPISTGGSRSFPLNWSRMVGSLEPGRYRIVKVFTGYEQISLHQSSKEPLTQICTAEFEINPLGIALHTENATPLGVTLICTQNGTAWESITTGSDWSLEQWTENGWVSVLPEDTAWTAIGIGVNRNGTTSWNLNWDQIVGSLEPGRYRVGKTFLGTGKLTVAGDCATGEGVQQTNYAEFTIG